MIKRPVMNAGHFYGDKGSMITTYESVGNANRFAHKR